jgi:HK97 gp10 family phage protein
MEPIRIEIKNIDAVQTVFRAAPLKMTDEIHKAIQRSILTIERNVKREAPVNKKPGGGNLRQSVRSSMLGVASGTVEVGAEYGIYVEGGTRPHQIRPVRKMVLANRRTGEIFGRLVNHPGTKANPFFSRGVDQSRADIDRFFIKAVQNALT